ncbi:hypothetical protein [Streptomyces albicerus]|uniref:hypothetical protein n=1 Tax=Streptomyces albicerus TaxID=2569859 RepID=UPI001788C968|nr:hypothetical protein [Streptomyces albicerus]
MTAKHGRTGDMLFVTERREFRQRGRTCLVEEHDIVCLATHREAQHVTAEVMLR